MDKAQSRLQEYEDHEASIHVILFHLIKEL